MKNCPNCDGEGYIVESENDVECCGAFTKTGGCCFLPNIVQKPVQVPCEMCQTSGKIEDYE